MKDLYPLLGPVYMEVGDPRYRSGNPLRWGKIAGKISKRSQEFKILYESEILKAFKPCATLSRDRARSHSVLNNQPYGKRWRLYILYTTIPFEPNTANETINIKSYDKVIFVLTKFVPVIAPLSILGLKFIKLFCAFL